MSREQTGSESVPGTLRVCELIVSYSEFDELVYFNVFVSSFVVSVHKNGAVKQTFSSPAKIGVQLPAAL